MGKFCGLLEIQSLVKLEVILRILCVVSIGFFARVEINTAEELLKPISTFGWD